MLKKNFAILDVDDEGCIVQLSVDEEKEGNEDEASDGLLLSLVETCCHRFSIDDSP